MIFLGLLMLLIGGVCGASYADYQTQRYWQQFGFCPTCQRLTCEREHD